MEPCHGHFDKIIQVKCIVLGKNVFRRSKLGEKLKQVYFLVCHVMTCCLTTLTSEPEYDNEILIKCFILAETVLVEKLLNL